MVLWVGWVLLVVLLCDMLLGAGWGTLWVFGGFGGFGALWVVGGVEVGGVGAGIAFCLFGPAVLMGLYGDMRSSVHRSLLWAVAVVSLINVSCQLFYVVLSCLMPLFGSDGSRPRSNTDTAEYATATVQ